MWVRCPSKGSEPTLIFGGAVASLGKAQPMKRCGNRLAAAATARRRGNRLAAVATASPLRQSPECAPPPPSAKVIVVTLIRLFADRCHIDHERFAGGMLGALSRAGYLAGQPLICQSRIRDISFLN